MSPTCLNGPVAAVLEDDHPFGVCRCGANRFAVVRPHELWWRSKEWGQHRAGCTTILICLACGQKSLHEESWSE